MTLNDFIKRIDTAQEENLGKMILIVDSKGGWSNVNMKVCDGTIQFQADTSAVFSDDK